MGDKTGSAAPSPELLQRLDAELLKLVTRHLDAKSLAALEQTSKELKKKIDPKEHADRIVEACATLQSKVDEVRKILVKAAGGKDPKIYGSLKASFEAQDRVDKIKKQIDLLKKGLKSKKEPAYDPAAKAIKALESYLKSKLKGTMLDS